MPQHCAGWSTAGTLWRIMPWGVAGANQTSAGGVTMQPFLDARSIMANVPLPFFLSFLVDHSTW
eukprot:1137724-Pelagomonas_calceolata.AAC.3